MDMERRVEVGEGVYMGEAAMGGEGGAGVLREEWMEIPKSIRTAVPMAWLCQETGLMRMWERAVQDRTYWEMMITDPMAGVWGSDNGSHWVKVIWSPDRQREYGDEDRWIPGKQFREVEVTSKIRKYAWAFISPIGRHIDAQGDTIVELPK